MHHNLYPFVLNFHHSHTQYVNILIILFILLNLSRIINLLFKLIIAIHLSKFIHIFIHVLINNIINFHMLPMIINI